MSKLKKSLVALMTISSLFGSQINASEKNDKPKNSNFDKVILGMTCANALTSGVEATNRFCHVASGNTDDDYWYRHTATHSVFGAVSVLSCLGQLGSGISRFIVGNGKSKIADQAISYSLPVLSALGSELITGGELSCSRLGDWDNKDNYAMCEENKDNANYLVNRFHAPATIATLTAKVIRDVTQKENTKPKNENTKNTKTQENDKVQPTAIS